MEEEGRNWKLLDDKDKFVSRHCGVDHYFHDIIVHINLGIVAILN